MFHGSFRLTGMQLPADGSYAYTYDAQGQLLTETYGGKTYTYTYDTYGNIRSVSDGTTTKVYSYGDSSWLDLLTAYDGQSISYDSIGNPTSWYDGTTFTWSNGRRLTSAVNSSTGLNNSYTYDMDGLRLTKTVGSVEHKYVWQGSKLVAEYFGGTEFEFFYDENGAPYAFSYKATASATPVMYYYVTNLQGDVVSILNASGTSVAEYSYNAWGKVLSATGTMAAINPIRYRGYYFDSDSGLYYVSSRYYNPEVGRWINADNRFDVGAGFAGYNLFAYCANNPVILFDPEGGFVVSTLLVCVIAGAIVGGTVGGFIGNYYANSKSYSGWEKTKCILAGSAIGGIGGGAIGYVAAPLVVSATGVAGISLSSSGISTVAAVGTSFGKMGTLIINDSQQIINWGRTTIHGVQRMAERGVTPSMAEYWVKTGKALQQTGDKILYVTRQGAVVVNKAGQIITAYTSQYFDENMQRIISKLFGK